MQWLVSCQLCEMHVDKEKSWKDVCVVSTHSFTVLSWCFIWFMSCWTERSIPTQFRCCGVSLFGRIEDRWNWKTDMGHLSFRRGAQSETWISGICLCLNHSCLYQVTHLSVKFVCSLPTFPLLSGRWSIPGRAQILPVRESAKQGL